MLGADKVPIKIGDTILVGAAGHSKQWAEERGLYAKAIAFRPRLSVYDIKIKYIQTSEPWDHYIGQIVNYSKETVNTCFYKVKER